MVDQIPTKSGRGWARVEAEHDVSEAEALLGHPMLVGVLRLWIGLCRNGEPPSREDIDSLILQPGVFPQILMLEGVEREGRRDLRYRVIGVGLAINFGNDMTGRFIRDVFADDAYADELVKASFLVIDRNQPIATSGRFVSEDPSEPALMTYRLALPMRKLPSGTPLLLVCQVTVLDGRIVERPASTIQRYEPISLVAFTDRRTRGLSTT